MRLHPDDLHVWRFDLRDFSSQPNELLLSEDERARASRFHFAQDRDRFVACRSELRRLLGRYLDTDPRELRFHYGPSGKPLLDGASFNVSHSRDQAVIIVGGSMQAGVDLETLPTQLDVAAISRRFFTEAENQTLERCGPGETSSAFLTIWTRKEACLKAIGIGIWESLARFDVGADLNFNEPLIVSDRITRQGLHVLSFSMDCGIVSIATDRPVRLRWCGDNHPEGSAAAGGVCLGVTTSNPVCLGGVAEPALRVRRRA